MQVEIEAKFLNIDADKVRRQLKAKGAVLVQSETLMTRRNYDYKDQRLQQVGGWLRVRDEGNKITLAYKQLRDRSLTGTKEVSVDVNNFEDTCRLIESIGLIQKSIQQTKRESWLLGDTQIEIDTWPWIPTFLEIEGPTEAAVKNAAKLFGLDWAKALHGSVEVAYQAYYDVTEEDIDGWDKIIFSDIPKWLNDKAK